MNQYKTEVKTMESKSNWRISMNLTPELEEAILSLRQREEYRRCSLSEIMRHLLEAGLEAEEREEKTATA